MNVTTEQLDAAMRLSKDEPILDDTVREIFPQISGVSVPPAPDHVLYDLRIPAFAGKLVVLGPTFAPMVWFTWCRPKEPIAPPVTGKHWIWIENGPVFWIVDLWFNRDLIKASTAAKLAFNYGLENGLIAPGEDVFFYRDPQGSKPGRYGRMKAPLVNSGRDSISA